MEIRSLPSGTVAFLFSDIEGSTVRWERDPVAMTAALRRHDAVLRGSIERAGGYVFKTIGDAFCASFRTAGDAATAALAAHRGLAREDFASVDGIRVRIAIHVGTADERDGDYFGTAVNRVARLLATAHGGQTVLSASATGLVRAHIEPGATIVSLGEHRLKDLAEMETIGQLNADGLPATFPPLRSLDVARHNLPTQLLPLVGREAVVAQIEAGLAAHRLVTLVGEGGIGKTRTALACGWNALDRFAGGVWYVTLSTITERANVAAHILAELGLRESPGRDPLESIALWLAAREALLVIDNCEHVVEEADRIVRTIVERCPHVGVLATSREALGTYGEAVVRMPALTVPPPGDRSGASVARTFEAVALFEARAAAVDANFALDDANAATVGDICRRLDGIALAIELAASRIKVLSPVQILAKLDERFRLLTGGRRNAEARQSTLHAAIAWSVDLLSQRDRTIFERDGVFAGSWPLEAAIAVCTDARHDDFDAIDATEALVNKSLVAVDETAEPRTYRLLESTRSFALLELERGGTADGVRARHAAYALDAARRLDAKYASSPTRVWEAVADATIADLRAAIAWSFESDRDLATGIAIVAHLRWYWSGVATSEGRALVRRTREYVTHCDVAPEILGKLAMAEAAIATSGGDYRTQLEAAQRARTHWLAVGNELELALADRTYAQALYFLGEPARALPILRASLDVLRRYECGTFASLALDTLGVHHLGLGELDAARRCLDEAIALARSAGYERGICTFNINLAEIEAEAGDLDRATALCRESLEQTYAKRDLYIFAIGWSNLAMYYTRLERYDDAFAAATTAFGYARESGAALFETLALQSVAAIRAAYGEAETAATLAGYVDARLAELGFERGASESAQYEALTATVARTLGDDARARARTTGLALDSESAVRLARLADAPARV